MNFVKDPKQKRNVHVVREQPFPVVIESVSGILPDDSFWQVFTGHYNGDCVVIDKPSEVHTLYTKGFFGKGSLSKSFPSFGKLRNGIPPFISERQWKRRCQWRDNLEKCGNIEDNTNQIKEEKHEVKTEVSEGFDSPNWSGPVTDESLNIADPNCNGEAVSTTVPPTPAIGPQVLPPELSEVKSEQSLTEEQSTSVYRPPTIKFRRQPPKKKTLHELNTKIPDSSTVMETKDSVAQDHPSDSLDSSSIELDSNLNFRLEDRCKTDQQAQDHSDSDLVVVLRDSDSEDEEFRLQELGARLERDPYSLVEVLHLTLEEAFFLSFALGCLQVKDIMGQSMSLGETWDTFCRSQADFVQKYIAYHHFRAKGWVVKPGMKYGGDFLLYKQGPPFYHASYVVLVEVLEEDDWIRSPTHNRRSVSWTQLFAANRLAETVAKEVLVCQVVWPASVPQSGPRGPRELATFGIREVLLKRWVASQERNNLDDESSSDTT